MHLISGTGHCGSTAMLMLFEALGYETGNSTYPMCFREFLRDYRVVEQIEKGETPVWPEVIKHLGGFCYNLKSYVNKWNWKVDHVFILIRSLDESVNKRKTKMSWKSLQVSKKRFDSMKELEKEEKLRNNLIHQIGSLIYSIGELDYSCTLINYPRFAEDKEYCFRKLSEGLNLSKEKFDIAYGKVIKSEKIHKY